MNTKPAWARGPEPRNDGRAFVATDLPSEIDLAECGQIAPLPTTKSPDLVCNASAYAALQLPTLLSR